MAAYLDIYLVFPVAVEMGDSLVVPSARNSVAYLVVETDF